MQLIASDLRYQFGRREVLRGLDFKLSAGGVTAFLGRNGAGKTTTLNLLAGVLRPDSGEVHEVNGLAPWRDRQLRARIGYLTEIPALYPDCTVAEQLAFAAALRGLDCGAVQAAVDRAIERCDLGEIATRLTDNLSKGFRQRVALAQAIIHQPDILLLDEPGSGLDPVQMENLRQLIESLAQEVCVVFSTHILGEALSIGNDILVIRDGRQQYFGPRSELPGTRSTNFELRLETKVDKARLEQIEGIRTAQVLGENRWLVQLADGAAAATTSAAIVERGWGLCELTQHNNREQQLLSMMAGGGAQS